MARAFDFNTIMYAYHDEVTSKISARMSGFDSKGAAI
jgi:hypothetical protein